MIFGETASVCALPAPVKPKRCFRSPPLSCALPLPWSALGLTFPIAFSIWAMKQQENTLWAVAGSGKMCRFPQPAIRWGRWTKGWGKVCRKNLNTTCIFHMPRLLFIIPLNTPCLCSSWQEDCRLCSPKTSIHVAAAAVAVVAGDAM